MGTLVTGAMRVQWEGTTLRVWWGERETREREKRQKERKMKRKKKGKQEKREKEEKRIKNKKYETKNGRNKACEHTAGALQQLRHRMYGGNIYLNV